MDNLSGKVALSSSSFAGNMREGIIKVVTGGVWLRGNPSCIVDVQGDASVLSVSLYSLSSDADVEVRVPQHVLDGVVTVSYTHLDVYKRQEYNYINTTRKKIRR